MTFWRHNRSLVQQQSGGEVAAASSVVEVGKGATVFGTASIAVAYPTGIASGDLGVVCLSRDGANTVTAPAGWTRVPNFATSHRCQVYYRVLDGTETGTGTFTVVASQRMIARMIAFRGPLTASPFDVSAIQTAVNTGDVSLPAVTPTTASSLVIQCHAGGSTGGGSPAAHVANNPVEIVREQNGADEAAITASYFLTTTMSAIAAETVARTNLDGFYQGSRSVFKVTLPA